MALAAAALPGAAPAAEPSLWVTPGGSDANPCTQAAPCRTLNRAYNLAKPGQVVEVAAGRYPGETIRDSSGVKTGPTVLVRPAEGATVSFTGALALDNARHLTLRDLVIEGFNAYWSLDVRCANDVTLENVGGGRRLHISRSENVLVKGGWWGNYGTRGEQDSLIGHGGSNCSPARSGGPSRNVTLDGVTFRDVFWGRRVSDFSPESHPDCLQLDEVTGLTIRNSRFLRCAQVFIGFYGDGHLRNVVIENNVFAKIGTDSYYGTVLEDTGKPGSCADVVFRHNTHDESGGSNGLASQGYGFLRVFCKGTGVRVVGNLFHTSPRAGSCGLNGAVWTHNVYERPDVNGFACGAAAHVGDPAFVNRSGNDYHVTSASAALDRGNGADYAPTDFDGETRFSGSAPDAGADERDGGAGPPPPPADQCADGADNDGDGLADAADPGCQNEADGYAPACAPDCDAQIAALQQDLATARQERDAAVARANGYRSRLDQIHSLSAPD